jgi:hypothetical protein
MFVQNSRFLASWWRAVAAPLPISTLCGAPATGGLAFSARSQRPALAAARTAPAAWASAPIQDTMSTAARAPACRPRPADDGRAFVDRSPGPWAEDIQPRRPRRPQHVTAGREAPIPAVDDELCLQACGAVRLHLGGAGFDVEPASPDAHEPRFRRDQRLSRVSTPPQW